MATVTTIIEERPLRASGIALTRAVSWPAIVAGAIAAAALSLILLMLGIGLGLSALSPWGEISTSPDAISLSAILWVAFVAIASSGLGGYMAGRLRESWPGVHGDEVYFRDTAHGFLAWGLATLITAATLGSVIGAIAKTAAPVAALAGAVSAAGTAAAQPRDTGNDWNYAVDSLLRLPAAGAQPPVTAPPPDDTRARAEISHIFDNSQTANAITPEDAHYVGQILSQYRGYAAPDAEQRTVDAFNAALSRREKLEQKAREVAEEGRRNAARASMWTFISLLLGAFSASLMATFGGRQRDLP